MSPSHLDFDRTISELRAETPSGEARARSLEAVLRPHRRRLTVPVLVGACVIAAAVFLPLMVHRGGALAWSDVLQNTKNASSVKITETDAKGKVIGTQWSRGGNRAFLFRDETGRLIDEYRCNEHDMYLYLYQRAGNAPNAYQYATLYAAPKSAAARSSAVPSQDTVDELLRRGRTRLLSQSSTAYQGVPVERYELLIDGTQYQTVDADPQTRRILYIHFATGDTDKYEYPAQIDPSIFSYKSRLMRDVPVLDARGVGDPRKTPPYTPKVIASKGGIQLREVSLRPQGDLFVDWTGYMPAGAARKRFDLVGVQWSWFLRPRFYRDGVHKVTGPRDKRLISCILNLPEKIGATVTLKIPTAGGFVEFKDVKVQRMQPLKD